MPKVSIVVPCYFNEGNIPITTQKLIETEAAYGPGVEFEYVMVDDGSKDQTWPRILDFQAKYPDKVIAVKLSRNFGTHNSALAGLGYTTGDFIGFLAADLQDPPELIPKMYEYWKQGFKLVLANRSDREDSAMTKMISGLFHFFMRKFALPGAPTGGFDLWFFDRELRDQVVQLAEKNTHISYLFIWLGYDYVNIPYVRRKREIGKSQWILRKQIKAMIDSVLSFSYFPVRLITCLGLLLGAGALLYSLLVIVAALRNEVAIPGWSSLMVVFLVVSSFQMVALGVLGEYLWRVLDNTRARPNFVVDKVVK